MDTLYVTANFKETQVERMLKGQAATFRVDAGTAAVLELSRTQVLIDWPVAALPKVDDWFAGVLDLAGNEDPLSDALASSLSLRAPGTTARELTESPPRLRTSSPMLE